MRWYHGISYFFGGAFLVTAIPYLVSGVTGHPFESPLATPSALLNNIDKWLGSGEKP